MPLYVPSEVTLASLLSTSGGLQTQITASGAGAVSAYSGTSISIPNNTAVAGITLSNPLPATNTGESYSPFIELQGQGWKTNVGGSQSMRFRFGVMPTDGFSTTAGALVFQSSANSGAWVDAMYVDKNGLISTNGSIASNSGLVSAPMLVAQSNAVKIAGNGSNGSITLSVATNSSDVQTLYLDCASGTRTLTIQADSVLSGTGATTTALTNASGVLQNQITALSGTPVQPYAITYAAGAGFTATTMGNAVNFVGGSAGYVAFVDLTRFTGVNLSAVKLGTAGTTTGALYLGYFNTFSATATNYTPLATSGQMLAINVTNTLLNSGYAPITAAARSGVYVALLTTGGNATLSPVFGMVTASFK
jgi:hypothetical protein